MKDTKTIEQQVQILIDRGLIVADIDLAKDFLNQVNYYRFSGYLRLFSVNDIFNGNTTFENKVSKLKKVRIEVYKNTNVIKKILGNI